MLYKKTTWIFLCFLVLFFISSCIPRGSTVLGVSVYLNPYGEGDEITTGDDFIIYSYGSQKNCRPSTPDINTIKPFLRQHGLLGDKNSGILDILGLEVETSEDENQSDAGISVEENTEAKEPVKIEVGDSWLKIGLEIRNGSDYHLVVTDIVFKAEGKYRGQIFPYQNNISAGYCDSLPNALYFIPKNSRVEYKPHSKDMLNNMTIYIDGFPVIDRISGTGGGDTPAASTTLPEGGTASPGSSLTTNPDIARGCYISVPRYKVEMYLRGYFLTDKGNQLRAFDSRHIFYTRSLDEC